MKDRFCVVALLAVLFLVLTRTASQASGPIIVNTTSDASTSGDGRASTKHPARVCA